MYVCNICEKAFDNHRALNGHKNSHKSKRYSKSKSKKTINNCLNCNNKTINPKYCCNDCQVEYQLKLKELSIENGEATYSLRIKKYLIKKYGHVCSKCNNNTWNNKPIPLDLEHIDGNFKNNKLENLCLLCPNCHRQTETWGMKNFYKIRAMGQTGRRCSDTAKINGSTPL